MPRESSPDALPEGATNVAILRALLDSVIAFHGLKPHVSDQIAQHLHRNDVVSLRAVPAALRLELRKMVR